MMEDLVLSSTDQIPLSPSYQRVHDAGVAEGEAKGEIKAAIKSGRNTVLMVLKARNLEPTSEQRRLVETCEDLETLKLWAERAVTATSTGDVFR